MKRYIVISALALLAHSAAAITATKAYVDRKDAETAASVAETMREKTDMAVYGQSAKPRLPAECFPVQVYGVNYGPDDVAYYFDAIDNRYLFEAGPSFVFFYLPDLTFAPGHEMTFNGKTGIDGKWPKLEFATIPTGDRLATTSEVATVASSFVNAVYDEKLNITWQAKMYDGNLYYVAVTNANVTEVAE